MLATVEEGERAAQADGDGPIQTCPQQAREAEQDVLLQQAVMPLVKERELPVQPEVHVMATQIVATRETPSGHTISSRENTARSTTNPILPTNTK